MTELTAIHAKITGDASGFVAAAKQADTAAAGLNKGAVVAAGGMSRFGSSISNIAKSNSTRMLSFQLSQVAQQTMVTGNLTRALATQLPDMGLAFGAVGAAAGVLAGIALPLLMESLGDTTNAADKMADALDELVKMRESLSSSLGQVNLSIQEMTEKFGAGAEAARQMVVELARVRVQQAEEAMRDLSAELAQFGDGVEMVGKKNSAANREIRKELDLTIGEHERLTAAIQDVQSADGIEAQAESYSALMKILGDLGLELSDLGEDNLDLAEKMHELGLANIELEATLKRVEEQAGKTGQAIQSVAAMGYTMHSAIGLPVKEEDRGKKTGGGVRGSSGPTELEKLQEQLMTAGELESESYAKRQEILEQALAQRQITQDEFNDLSDRAQRQHVDKMAQIYGGYYGGGLRQAGAFFGDMAQVFASGNEKMQRISRAFAAGEALINAWRAYSQTIADPSLPFVAKLAAGAKVLAAGMGAVNAIRSGSSSSGSAASASASAATEATTTASQRPAVSLTLIGNEGFTSGHIVQIAEALNSASDDGAEIIDIRGR